MPGRPSAGLAVELFCFTTEFVMGSWLFIKSQIAKNPSHCCNGFINLKTGNVLVPTAVESHSANATLSLCRVMSMCQLRTFYFSADVKKPDSFESGSLQFEAW